MIIFLTMRLLLISNSTNAGEPYLQYPMPAIKKFLGTENLKCVFIPYAGVTVSFDEYTGKVKSRFAEIGHELVSIHGSVDPVEELEEAEVIIVGGGNTWQLLKMIQEGGLIDTVRRKVLNGTPYIGWSAGSNMACPTIRTTNDMPIVQPEGFHAFDLIPFQINPHYIDANPEGHAGETREARILEFIEVNRGLNVVGLREGSILEIEHTKVSLLGSKPARLFHYGKSPVELLPGDDLDFLLLKK
jgi:dipeptidase E